jgi:hypothetical protein
MIESSWEFWAFLVAFVTIGIGYMACTYTGIRWFIRRFIERRRDG